MTLSNRKIILNQETAFTKYCIDLAKIHVIAFLKLKLFDNYDRKKFEPFQPKYFDVLVNKYRKFL